MENKIKTIVELDSTQAQASIIKLGATASNTTKGIADRIEAKNKQVEIQNSLSQQTISNLEKEIKALEGVSGKEKELSKTTEKLNKAKLDAIKQNESGKVSIDKLQAIQDRLTESNTRLSGAYAKLVEQKKEAKKTLQDLISTQGTNITGINKAQKSYNDLAEKVNKADVATQNISKSAGKMSFAGMTKSVSDLVGAFGVAGGITMFASVLKGAYVTMKKFEQGVADLSAITGAAGKDLAFLSNAAVTLGEDVDGGAFAVVEAYKLIASAKPELLSNVKALNMVTEATLTLSQAAGMEMPAAASALTDAMNQFNAPAEKASVFIDTLANGAKYGAAEIPQITDALLRFGAVARSTNVTIQESTALIEVLAEKGLKGADAGIALRNVLLKISAPETLPGKARDAMAALGVSFDTLKDKSLPIKERLEALKPLLNDTGALTKVFGVENVVAARNVLENTKRLGELTKQMYDFGTAEEQARKRMDTLTGDTIKLSSTYDSLVLSVTKGSGVISNSFRTMVQGITDLLKGLIRVNSSWDELYNKAKTKGLSAGTKSYNVRTNQGAKQGGDPEEVAKNIKTEALTEYKKLKAEYDKAEIDLKNAEKASKGINFGESPKSVKERKEKLLEELNFQVALIRESNKTIDSLKQKPVNGEEETSVIVNKEDVKAKGKAKGKADKDAEDDKRRRLANELELLKDGINEKRANNEATLALEIEFLEKKNKIDIQATGLNKSELLSIENKHQMALDEVRKTYSEKEKAEANKKLTDQITLDQLEIDTKKAHGDRTLALELELLEKKKIQDLTFVAKTEEEKKAILKKFKLDKEKLQQEDKIKKLELIVQEDALEIERIKAKGGSTYVEEKKLRDDALNLELADISLSEDAKNKIKERAALVDRKLRDEQVDSNLNAAAEMFGVQKELAVAQMIMAAPQAVGDSFKNAAKVYAPPVSGIMGALGAATVIVPIVKGLSDIKKARFPGSKKGGRSSGGGGSQGISSTVSTGVSTSSVTDLAANNAARLGVDPSLGSNATANAANKIAGGSTSGIIFSESKYNDFKKQVAFKESKITI